MKVYIFRYRVAYRPEFQQNLLASLDKIAETTETKDLVVAVYLTRGKQWAGHLLRQPMTSARFARRRGRWAFTQGFQTPADLPEKFALIRLKLGMQAGSKRFADSYGWSYRCGGFYFDGVANLFAHELHHFRRWHLGLHPRESEHSANKWALARAREAGFQVELDKRTKKSRPGRAPGMDPRFAGLRALPEGARVRIKNAYNRPQYLGQLAEKLGSLRANARRMRIRTSDGRSWRWPMEGLELPDILQNTLQRGPE
ncbi:MAG: hypothetical protein WC728_13540 [Elusimicrobiota bacterium]